MKKLLAIVFAMVCILSLAGCDKSSNADVQIKDLPIPEYPLSTEAIENAIVKVGLPNNLTIEEDTPHDAEGAESTLFVLRHPTAELFDGICMEVISHEYDGDSNIYGFDDCAILGISVSTIDRNEIYTREEVEQAIRFATYLVWQDESDTRICDLFIEEYDSFVENEESYRKTHGASSPMIEDEIDNVQYIIAYTPTDAQTKFKIRFQVPLVTGTN